MRMKVPTIHKDWLREVKFALEEALSIRESSIGHPTEINEVNLFKMAPGIGAIYRNIENEEEKQAMIDVSWSAVYYIHEQMPEYTKKYRRCFVHAYPDSMIHLKLITRKKAEKVIDRLEAKGLIEK